MNAKIAKKIRKLSVLLRPDAEVETTYKIKAHRPRYGMRTVINDVEVKNEAGEVVRVDKIPKNVQVRVNTNQKFVNPDCRRGVTRIMKKAYRQNKALAA